MILGYVGLTFGGNFFSAIGRGFPIGKTIMFSIGCALFWTLAAYCFMRIGWELAMKRSEETNRTVQRRLPDACD